MSVPLKFIRYQGPVLRGMGEAAVGALKQRLGPKSKNGNGQLHGAPSLPGPEHRLTVAPRPAELVNAYVRWVGGDPASYKGRVPAHLFPQWGFPLDGKAGRGAVVSDAGGDERRLQARRSTAPCPRASRSRCRDGSTPSTTTDSARSSIRRS